MTQSSSKKIGSGLLGFILISGAIFVGYTIWQNVISSKDTTALVENQTVTITPVPVEPIPVVLPSHIATPDTVRAVYLTGWTAGSKSSRARVMNIFDTTSVNSVVVDVKDATGRLSYIPLDPNLVSVGVGTKRIADLPGLITELHQKGIYVIGRVQVFQDPYYALKFPDEAYHTLDGSMWRDNRGISWLRANSQAVWDYTVAISKDAYAQGFDEINVDYVRFPSDGKLDQIDRTLITKDRASTIADFFSYLDEQVRGAGIPLSADIFGLTLTAQNDLGIGQKLELIAPHVDYVCPMIYPSHFWTGSFGFEKPAEHPYEIIHAALSGGITKLTAASIAPTKLRPWLQDFDLLGVPYTTEKVQAQIDASVSLGVNSWLMWDPRNRYTLDALQ